MVCGGGVCVVCDMWCGVVWWWCGCGVWCGVVVWCGCVVWCGVCVCVVWVWCGGVWCVCGGVWCGVWCNIISSIQFRLSSMFQNPGQVLNIIQAPLDTRPTILLIRIVNTTGLLI